MPPKQTNSALTHIPTILNILRSSSTTGNDLLRSRDISAAFRNAVDDYAWDIWASVLSPADLANTDSVWLIQRAVDVMAYITEKRAENAQQRPPIATPAYPLTGYHLENVFYTNMHVDIDRLLMSFGLDINIRLVNDQSPLETAIRAFNMPLIRTILEAGADVNIRVDDGDDMLRVFIQQYAAGNHLIRESVLFTIIRMLEAYGFTPSPGDDYADIGDFSFRTVVTVLSHYRVNGRNAEHNTPLHAACINAYDTAISALIARGAVLEARDDFDRTPLLVAAFHGNLGCIRALIREGADVGVFNREGNTALMIMVRDIKYRMVSRLERPGEIGERAQWYLNSDFSDSNIIGYDNALSMLIRDLTQGIPADYRNNAGRTLLDLITARDIPQLTRIVGEVLNAPG